jgi:hypothetical protein
MRKTEVSSNSEHSEESLSVEKLRRKHKDTKAEC